VLVGHPRLLGRILVPYLSDALCLVCSHVSFYSLPENSCVDRGAIHCLKALLVKLLDIKAIVISLASGISCRAVHRVVGLTDLFSSCVCRAIHAVCGFTDLVGLGAVVTIVVHAGLLVSIAVLTMFLLAVCLACHVVRREALIVSIDTRFTVSRLTEVITALAVMCLSAHILLSLASHVPVL